MALARVTEAQANHANDEVTCHEDGGSDRSSTEGGGLEMGQASGVSLFSGTEERTSFDSTSNSAGTESLSPYFSTRCQSMEERRSEFLTELDFRIQVSKEHWSELSTVEDHAVHRKKQVPLGMAIAREFSRVFLGRKIVTEEDTTTQLHSTESLEKSREVFERLKREQHSFFQDFEDLELEGKIAEGGQAEIFEARCSMRSCDGTFSPTKCVVKVMKEGFSLQSLQSQWSPKLRRRLSQSNHRGCGETQLSMTDACVHGTGTSSIIGGTLLKNGRFAFVLEKYCGDLRNLIDLRMREKGNHGPPFEERVALRIIGQIARGMYTLHKSNVLHRDLKASNVLVERFAAGAYNEYPDCYVADFECSVGVEGTGFWRAPEILAALKKRRTTGAAAEDASSSRKKADVYSFGMTSYEVLTGLRPFEGQAGTNYDLVLSGHRPDLPDDIDARLRALVRRCWEEQPAKRPTFQSILKALAGLMDSVRQRVPPGAERFEVFGWLDRRTWYLDRAPAAPDA